MNLLDSIKADEQELIKLQEENGYEPEKTGADDNRTSNETDDDEIEEVGEEGDSGDGAGGKSGNGSDGEKSDGGEADSEEESTESQKTVLEVPKDAAAWAQMRREKRLLRQMQLDEAAARKQQPYAASDADNGGIPDPEPNKIENYEAWLEWKDRQLEAKVAKIESWQQEQLAQQRAEEIQKNAVKEYLDYERAFILKNPDYELVTKNAYNRIYQGYLDLNPGKTPDDAAKYVMNYTLSVASEAVREGLNPAEAVYMTAKMRFGVPSEQAQPQQSTQPKETQQRKVADLKRIDNNRKKSASSLVGGSNSNASVLSLESLDKMSMAEFSKLTPSMLKELESQVA